jgi:hypothetical protein
VTVQEHLAAVDDEGRGREVPGDFTQRATSRSAR